MSQPNCGLPPPPPLVCQFIRNKFLDPDAFTDTKYEKPFISLQTIQQIFESAGSYEISGQWWSTPDDSLVVLSALLLTGLEHHYELLLRSGLKDDTLFDADPFEHSCQNAGLSDPERARLRESRARFGVLLHQGKRPTLSKGLVLPYLARVKKDNGSFGVIYQDQVAPGHLRDFDPLAVSPLAVSRVVAEKQIRPKDCGVGDKQEWDRLCREAITYEKRQHPNIVPLLASYLREDEDSERDIKTLHLIFPWADMDLAKWMDHTPTPISTEESSRRDIYRRVYALVSGLSYLHREIAEEITSHHDIKPSNILVFGSQFKLADFGNTHIRPSYLGSETEKDVLGTYAYQPPEYWTDSGDKADLRHGRAFDAWAMGCVIIELVLLIVYGWSSREVSEFRKARLENPTKRRPLLYQRRFGEDNSFHNNKNVVEEWVTRIKQDGSKRATDLVLVAEGLTADNRQSRLPTWEAEMDLYTIYDVDADRPQRLERNALCVQPPPRRIPNGTSTPLHRAAQKVDWDRVKDLLEHRWPLFVQDAAGMTPADIIEKNALHMERSCLQTYKKYFAAHDMSREATCGESNLFDLLRNQDDGHNKIHSVLDSRRVDKLERVLAVMDKKQLRRRDPRTKLTPLQQAATLGSTKHIKLLLDCLEREQHLESTQTTYASDIEDPTPDGKTALFLAIENGHFATTEVLMAHEAQIFTQCKQQNTPIHAIASAEDVVWSEKALQKLLGGEEATRCFEL
ncbi:MAG: hypothetical protein Q9212_005995 [Teloschistes hypoglaucus]